jgi:hypothetical protein
MSGTAKMRDVIQETIQQMDEYHYWQEDGWGPEPRKPNVETVVKALKSKKKEEPFVPTCINVEVESTPDAPAPLTLRDLVVGETFSFTASASPKNVYMVIGAKGDTWRAKPGDTIRKCVMLKNGAVYEHNIDSYVRRRPCSLKVAP